jgi:hypothetical protein
MEAVPQNLPFRPGSNYPERIYYLIIPRDLIRDNQPTGNMQIQKTKFINKSPTQGGGWDVVRVMEGGGRRRGNAVCQGAGRGN